MSTTPTIVQKGWGYELIFASNDMFCGKILHFNKGEKSSMHFHDKKTEAWYVYSGRFNVTIIDTKDATRTTIVLTTGKSMHIPRLCLHQIESIEEGDIVEVSTSDELEDSYRVEEGASQKKKVYTLSQSPTEVFNQQTSTPIIKYNYTDYQIPSPNEEPKEPNVPSPKQRRNRLPSWFVPNG